MHLVAQACQNLVEELGPRSPMAKKSIRESYWHTHIFTYEYIIYTLYIHLVIYMYIYEMYICTHLGLLMLVGVQMLPLNLWLATTDPTSVKTTSLRKEAVVEYSRVESSIPAFQYSSECTVRQVFTMIASVSTQEADAEHTSHIYNITQTQG